MTLSKILFGLGVFLLFHAGYSTVQHKSFLKLAEEDYEGLPSDIMLECILAVILCCAGVWGYMGKFQDVRLSMELNSKSCDSTYYRKYFMIFNHRGHVLRD